ncbi:putative alpha-tubulin polyglutamylase Ttll1 [Diplonema papillatum]|nr:putative alpha-tubulin polyglutamylase Ttll1 [Diplonema papillatum]
MPRVLRYDQDRVPPVLRSYLASKGWEEYDETVDEKDQPPWNLWWKSARFTVSQLEGARFPMQRLNHFPKSSEITKKDTLLRNLRRMKGIHGQICDFLPESFLLPGEYVKFCQTYASCRNMNPNTTWICKPSELSRGRKIFVFQDIGDLSYDCSSVVQAYIDRPLLLSGYKFDLRVYVLVTSFQPLRAYIYRNLLVRFSTQKYDMSDLGNLCSHLTNTSLNKLAPGCEKKKEGIGEGCKWDAATFEAQFLSPRGIPVTLLWERIESVVNVTLLSICTAVPAHKACFELYGFDLLVDSNLKPWLLEVNFSPALHIDCPVDEVVKAPLMADMIDTLDVQEHPSPQGTPSGSPRSFASPRVQTTARSATGRTKRPSDQPPDHQSNPQPTAPEHPKSRRSVASPHKPDPVKSPSVSADSSSSQDAERSPLTSLQQSRQQTTGRPCTSGPSQHHGTNHGRSHERHTMSASTLTRPPGCNSQQQPGKPSATEGSLPSTSQSGKPSTILKPGSTQSLAGGSQLAKPACKVRVSKDVTAHRNGRSVGGGKTVQHQPNGGGAEDMTLEEFREQARGRFAPCFPFNAETHNAARTLAACPLNERDSAMRLIVAEIRKREAPASQRCRVLSRKLFPVPTASSPVATDKELPAKKSYEKAAAPQPEPFPALPPRLGTSDKHPRADRDTDSPMHLFTPCEQQSPSEVNPATRPVPPQTAALANVETAAQIMRKPGFAKYMGFNAATAGSLPKNAHRKIPLK